MVTQGRQNIALDELRRELLRLRDYTEGKLRSLNRAMENVRRADEYRLFAEALQANLSSVPRGVAEVRLTHPVAGDVVVPLDKRLDAVGNMERYWRQFRRLRRGAKKVEEQIARTEQELQKIEEWLQRVEAGEWVEEAAGAVRRFLTTPKEKKQQRKRLRRFVSSDGFAIYVGRNAKENDWLTLFFASAEDLFLHAHGCSGSHVIVKTGGKEVPQQTLYEAALLAAHYSKARGRPAAVTIAKVADVRKPPSAKDGLVLVRKWHTIRVGVDEKTLQRLLAQLEEKDG